MRNYLLFVSLLTAGLFTSAQQATSHRDNKWERLMEKPVVMQTGTNNHHQSHSTGQHRSGASRGTSILNTQRIGSAGNLLTVIEGGCNQIDASNDLNLVTFIHRCDPTPIPSADVPSGSAIAKYAYDVSKNRGLSWTSDIGAITNNAGINNNTICGRFPQALIYNQSGNTIADSAHFIYSGTWHDNNTWCGQMRGRGKLSGDLSTYNVAIDQVNSKHVGIATGMCKGAPGVFWNLNTMYDGTFNAAGLTNGLVIQKGVWNTTTRNVDWTDTNVPVSFETYPGTNNATVSAIAGFGIAFDPTGQYGWIAVLGDITNDGDSVLDPIFWKTIDGGNTWSQPIWVDLDSIQGVQSSLNPNNIVNGDPTSLNPTTAFDMDLSVDVNGNPHLLTTVGNGGGYSIEAAGYDVWDITYDPNSTSCAWRGIHLAEISTLRGDMTGDAQPQTMDNRPLISRSEDGHKLFFFWSESDAAFLGGPNNDFPNLYGRAIDVVDEKITPLYNFTEGDSLWGGETSNNLGGEFGAARFPVVGVTALQNGNVFNVPLVLTQVDYPNFTPFGQPGSSENPAAFYYISNINFDADSFYSELDQVPPTITLNGPDTMTILLNSTYTEAGATAFDCTDGNITPVIQNSPNTSTVGVYNVLYIATDAAGNSDTVVRTVIVGATPVADFSWSFPQNACKAQFQDLSANLPTSWLWNFGDGSGSTAKNPVKTFSGDGTYNVCLTSTNSFGTSIQVCKQVTVSGCIPSTGIDDLNLGKMVSMFPNPSNGKVSITLQGNVSTNLTVTVYNVLGETVVNPTTYRAGTTNIQLDLSSVANGLYLVKVQSESETTVKHLTISHK